MFTSNTHPQFSHMSIWFWFAIRVMLASELGSIISFSIFLKSLCRNGIISSLNTWEDYQ